MDYLTPNGLLDSTVALIFHIVHFYFPCMFCSAINKHGYEVSQKYLKYMIATDRNGRIRQKSSNTFMVDNLHNIMYFLFS